MIRCEHPVIAHEQTELLARIISIDKASDLRGCDLIIEAVFEQRALKASVTSQAEPMLATGGFLDNNTSTLPISSLAAASERPENLSASAFSVRYSR